MYAMYVPNNNLDCLESLKYFYEPSKYLFRFKSILIYRKVCDLVLILVIISNCEFIFLNDLFK